MPIVSVKDVEQLSGRTFTSTDSSVVAALIIYVQDSIETYLSRAVEPRLFSNEKIAVDWQQNSSLSNDLYSGYTQLYVKNPPVSSVSSLLVNGALIDPGTYSVQSWGITYFGLGVEFNNLTSSAWLSLPVNEFSVTYTGGLDGRKNETIKLVLIQTVLRELAKSKLSDAIRTGAQSIKVEDFAVTYPTTLPILNGPFLPQETKMLDPYRIRMVV